MRDPNYSMFLKQNQWSCYPISRRNSNVTESDKTYECHKKNKNHSYPKSVFYGGDLTSYDTIWL